MPFQDKKIVIATHFFNTGPAQNLEEYLISQKINRLLNLSHPLRYDQEGESVFSVYRLYAKGLLIKEKKIIRRKYLSEIFNFAADLLKNVSQTLKTSGTYDLFVGSGNLNVLSGIILRSLGKVKKVAYYSIDFVPERFPNYFLNQIYRLVEKICVRRSDLIWNLSPRMIEGREKYLHLAKNIYAKKQILVPEGVWNKRTNVYPIEKINHHHLVYLGHLAERMGVQMVINALPVIAKKIPDLKFIIIGKGEYRPELEKLAKKLNVENIIDFKGFIPDHSQIEQTIGSCGLGIATYVPDPNSLSYYADPGKTKIYMSAGVPVLMTNLFYNAAEIQTAKGGILVQYNHQNIAEAILKVIQNKKKWLEYRKGALNYMRDLDWNLIFIKCLTTTLSNQKNERGN